MTPATFTMLTRYAMIALLFLAVGVLAAMALGAVARCLGG